MATTSTTTNNTLPQVTLRLVVAGGDYMTDAEMAAYLEDAREWAAKRNARKEG